MTGHVGSLAITLLACAGCQRPASLANSPSQTHEGLPAGTIIAFGSGETQEGAAGAAVTIAGRGYTADDMGLIRLIDATQVGAVVDVAHPSYLDRQTFIRDREVSRLSLWPRSSPTGLDEDFTRRVVYGSSGAEALIRWDPSVRTILVVPSPQILDDATALEVHHRACDILSRAAGGSVVFQVAATATGPTVHTIVDPLDPLAQSGAGMRRTHSGFTITGGTIVFKNPTGPRNLGVLLHELGHAYGLSHSPHGQRDIMGPGPDDHTDFSAAEKLGMHLMTQRAAGTLFPDNDRSVTSASGSTDVEEIRCDLGTE